MTNFLYDLPEAIAIISGVFGIIAGVIALIKFMEPKKENKDGARGQSGRTMVLVIAIALLGIALSYLFTQSYYTRVPNVCGMTYSEAEQALFASKLSIGLSVGKSRADLIESEAVIFQSLHAGEVVKKHETVYVDFETYKSANIVVPDTNNENNEPDKSDAPDFGNKEDNHNGNETIITEEPQNNNTGQKEAVQNSESVTENNLVPSVIGLSFSEAEKKLNKAGVYSVAWCGEEDYNDETIVVWQSIPAGIPVWIDMEITLEISYNKEAIKPESHLVEGKVPSVIGLMLDEAFSKLNELGIMASWYGTDDGYVIKQSVPAGTQMWSDMTIELEIISKELGSIVEVPFVVGMDQETGIGLIKAAGLRFCVWWTEENNNASDTYYIVSQDINSGLLVEAGTIVELELSPNKP